nr:hypothetical protein [uncultured Rhodoferax sp.]
MAIDQKCKLGAALSAAAMVTLLLVTGAGSTAALAQTSTTLQPPTSGLKNAQRNGLVVGNAPLSPHAAPVAAPVAAPMGQIGQVPAVGVGPARVSASTASAKNYVLKTQVVPGAALSATQKLATAMAALTELAKQAKDQQDKETEEKIAQLQKTLSIGNSATLSLLSPKSAIGTATLSVNMAHSLNFENNQVSFNPSSLKQYGNLLGWPAAYCHFKVSEDGFYMVAFTVETPPRAGGTTTLTAAIRLAGYLNPETEAKATLNVGVNVVAIVKELRKGEDAISRITSDDFYAFNNCEISRIK